MSTLLQTLRMAAAWFALFRLNGWAIGYFDTAQFISWVFLAAAGRLLGVMLFGWRAAAGLFIGTLATNGATFRDSVPTSFAVALLSALGPLVALHVTMHLLQMPLTLHSLTPRRLAVFAVVGALCNVVLHNLIFWIAGLEANPWRGLVPMFVGDLLGIVIVLYCPRAALLLVERRIANPDPVALKSGSHGVSRLAISRVIEFTVRHKCRTTFASLH